METKNEYMTHECAAVLVKRVSDAYCAGDLTLRACMHALWNSPVHTARIQRAAHTRVCQELADTQRIRRQSDTSPVHVPVCVLFCHIDAYARTLYNLDDPWINSPDIAGFVMEYDTREACIAAIALARHFSDTPQSTRAEYMALDPSTSSNVIHDIVA